MQPLVATVNRRTPRRLLPTRIKQAEYARNEFQITPEIGTSIEDVLAPEYWAHAAFQIKAHDRIEVRTEDAAWYAELYVLKAERLPGSVFTASVRLIRFVDLTDDAELKRIMAPAVELAAAPVPEATGEYEIQWKGPAKKFCIIRRSDKTVMRDGIASREEAQAAIDADLPAI